MMIQVLAEREFIVVEIKKTEVATGDGFRMGRSKNNKQKISLI